MEDKQVCPPALIFVIYMAIQVVIDIFQGYFNTAIVKIIILFIFGAGLNMLCQEGFTVVAWVLIFIPFVLMSLIVVIILYMLDKKETVGNVETEEDRKKHHPPVIVLPNNYSIQPMKDGCVVIVKHDLTTHGLRAVSRDIYCPTKKKADEKAVNVNVEEIDVVA
tara:strand:+ start:8387 stop:8878 length:492 start_codon:yes stop_codon:yes gene_type:complete